MTTKLEGVFQITKWDETPTVEGDDGSKLTHAKITQNYTGAIEGSSEIQYLMSYQSQGFAVFVGFETLSAAINGKSGSFVIQHNGKFENGVASSDFTIVPNFGREGLKGISGSGSFVSTENGQANYEITLDCDHI
ncbi:MAG: DUF3224 domain-containing protein [Proteobacteria bacterium]|nr:DUF3224 domain-containing protein [Pseudomonadota bacterium]